MHIKFQSKVQAKKALSKNGRIFGGCIMVGVTPCIDKVNNKLLYNFLEEVQRMNCYMCINYWWEIIIVEI